MYIDLTVPLDEQTPVYPGDRPTKITAEGTIPEAGFSDHYVGMATHVGTHIDAPAHMKLDGRTLDSYPVERFIGRGRLIDIRAGYSLARVEESGIRSGDIVLFWSGRATGYHDGAYFQDYPDMPAEIAEYLVAAQVSMVGLDMCSPDHEPYEIHKLLLAGDVLLAENLQSLERIHGDFEVIACPIKLALDGAPARVIVRLNQ